MKTEIRPSTFPATYDLFVNGHRAVSGETFTVCDQIAYALQHRTNAGTLYSEGAEIADVIRDQFSRLTQAGQK